MQREHVPQNAGPMCAAANEPLEFQDPKPRSWIPFYPCPKNPITGKRGRRSKPRMPRVAVRSILAGLLFLLLSTAAHATPALVQNCQKVNAGTPTQTYTVTIASSGGTTGCTSNFTAGDAIGIVYWLDPASVSLHPADLTTAAVSATGATITFSKGPSVVSGVTDFWNGIFYACPNDITSPTSSIAISVNMGTTYAGISAIYVVEVSGVRASGCLDSNANQVASTSSGGGYIHSNIPTNVTFTGSGQFVLAGGSEVNHTSIVMGNGCVTNTASCPSSYGAVTIPSNGSDTENGGSFPGSSAIFTGVVTGTPTGVQTWVQASAGNWGSVVSTAFLPPATSMHHRVFIY